MKIVKNVPKNKPPTSRQPRTEHTAPTHEVLVEMHSGYLVRAIVDRVSVRLGLRVVALLIASWWLLDALR